MARPLIKTDLSVKQMRFIQEYLVDLNATKAAERAGYAKGTARQQGSHLLSHPVISAKIKEEVDKRARKTGITAESVLERLNHLADRCMQFEPVMHFDREEGGMVQTMVEDENGQYVGLYKFDSAGANRALELLGKHLKLFTDRLEVDASDALADRLAKAMQRARDVSGE